MTQTPLATLKFRVSRAKTALDQAQGELRAAQEVVRLKQEALNEAMTQLDDVQYGEEKK